MKYLITYSLYRYSQKVYLLRVSLAKGYWNMSESYGLQFIKNLSPEKKAKLFDRIADEYYNVNFGTFSKSQIDLLMFSIYLDELIEAGECFDDYTLSKQLGIVQTSVRQFKKKKQLIYPRDYKWYEVFLKYNENAVFDGRGRIVINIPDSDVYLELQHAIEEIGGYVEVQLNPKLLKIPPEYYIELLLKIHQTDNRSDVKSTEKIKRDFIKKLNECYLKDNELNCEFTNKTFLTKLKEIGLKIGLDILMDVLPVPSIIAPIIKSLNERLFNDN